MDTLTIEELARCMAIAGEVYAKPVREEQVKAFYMILSDYPQGVIRKSFKAHMVDPEHGRWFPTPADLMRHIVGTEQQAADEAEVNCLTSWERQNLTGVEQATRRKQARAEAAVSFRSQKQEALSGVAKLFDQNDKKLRIAGGDK